MNCFICGKPISANHVHPVCIVKFAIWLNKHDKSNCINEYCKKASHTVVQDRGH